MSYCIEQTLLPCLWCSNVASCWWTTNKPSLNQCPAIVCENFSLSPSTNLVWDISRLLMVLVESLNAYTNSIRSWTSISILKHMLYFMWLDLSIEHVYVSEPGCYSIFFPSYDSETVGGGKNNKSFLTFFFLACLFQICSAWWRTRRWRRRQLPEVNSKYIYSKTISGKYFHLLVCFTDLWKFQYLNWVLLSVFKFIVV